MLLWRREHGPFNQLSVQTQPHRAWHWKQSHHLTRMSAPRGGRAGRCFCGGWRTSILISQSGRGRAGGRTHSVLPFTATTAQLPAASDGRLGCSLFPDPLSPLFACSTWVNSHAFILPSWPLSVTLHVLFIIFILENKSCSSWVHSHVKSPAHLS